MTIDHVAPWVQTQSGLAFDLLTPRAEDVSLADIAEHLSKINRFAGATIGTNGYTVAQHSVHVSRILEVWGAPWPIVREGLLHDAPEAYYGDVSSPVQRALRALFRETLDVFAAEHPALASKHIGDPFYLLKRRVDPVVRTALALPAEESSIVKRADLVALACERVALMSPCERDWNLPEFADTRWRTIAVEDSSTARTRFIQRHDLIATQINGSGA